MTMLRAVVQLWLAIAVSLVLVLQPASAQVRNDEMFELQGRFNQLYAQGRFADAVPLAEQISVLIKSRFGAASNEYGSSLYQIGNVLIGVSRHADAEQYLRRGLTVFGNNPNAAAQRMQASVMLATALIYQNKLDEGVPLMQRTATAFEAAFGLGDQRTVSTLNNLAQTLQFVGRGNEAIPIYRKLIATLDPALEVNRTNLGTLHTNLAAALTQTGQRGEALVEMRRGIDYLRKIGNPNHRFLAIGIGNLGKLEHDAGNFAEAERLYRESLESAARGLGPQSEVYAGGLINLAVLQRDMGRAAEAESTTRQSLAIFEKTLGPNHPKTGSVVNGLAVLLSARGDWAGALKLYDRATEIAVRNARAMGAEDGRIADTIFGLNPGDFPAHMRAIYHASPNDPRRRAEAFALAQRSLNSRTAVAISRMAARAAIPGSALAQLIREQQDLLRQRGEADQALVAVVGASMDRSQYDRARSELDRIESALQQVSARIKTEFPSYSAFDGTEPVPLAEVQRALKPREALVAFVQIEGNRSLPGEVHAWVVTAQSTQWLRLDIGGDFILPRATTLRCGLDAAMWRTAQGGEMCRQLTGVSRGDGDEQAGRPLPFDAVRAHELYAALFRPLESALRMPDGSWREMLVVASGPLAMIPLATLATELPPTVANGAAPEYRQLSWLGRRQAITMIPSIASIAALRRVAKPSRASKPIIGFGNPLLDGTPAIDRVRAEEARAKQTCGDVPARIAAGPVLPVRSIGAIPTAAGLAQVALIKAAPPLPETADEICAVARELNADVADMRLGARATEHEIKALSASGQLAAFRILHIATHGMLAGQLQGASEPGMILTPPRSASNDDDGYLSASEIATLKLDADWVILSACNTAGGQGDAGGAEALSGLARAFFYAGARALLVSHWEVDSQSTVSLITGTVGAIADDRRLGRAEALRRAMVEMIDHGTPRQAHPSFWAPFVVVGEGAAAVSQ